MRGSYGSCDPKNPEDVVEEWKIENPGARFVLSHDESGQFQSYWSLWRVIDEDTNVNEVRVG